MPACMAEAVAVAQGMANKLNTDFLNEDKELRRALATTIDFCARRPAPEAGAAARKQLPVYGGFALHLLMKNLQLPGLYGPGDDMDVDAYSYSFGADAVEITCILYSEVRPLGCVVCRVSCVCVCVL